MRHPIYDEELPEVMRKAAVLTFEGKHDQAQRMLKHVIDKFGEDRGEEHEIIKQNSEYSLTMMMMQARLSALVMITGFVWIDATRDEWFSPLSMKVISSITLDNFKMPFNTGVISISKRDYLFHKDEEGLLIVLLQDKYLSGLAKENAHFDEIIDLLAEDQSFPHAIFNDGSKTIGELVDDGGLYTSENSEGQKQEFYAVMSALMYVAMSNSSVEEFKDTVKRKKVLAKKRKSYPRHVTNVINVRQRVRVRDGKSVSNGSKSEKMWIVRGHWRNQYYSKTDEHKHKWIDPYFKGEGKVAAEKVYRI